MIQFKDFNYFVGEDATVVNGKGKIIKPDLSLPYTRIWFNRDGQKYSFYLHRVVAIVYIPNPENLPEVNHLDLDKRNCRKSNLEWSTHKNNINHFHYQAPEEYYAYLKNEGKVKGVIGESESGNVEFRSMSDGHRAGFKKSNIFTSIKTGIPYKGYRWRYV